MLLGVAAAVYAFERREIIRQTWGTYAESENVKVPFLVNVTYFVNLFVQSYFSLSATIKIQTLKKSLKSKLLRIMI